MGFRTSRLVRILDMSTGNLDPSEPCSLRKADRSCEEIYWGDWLHCDRGLEWLVRIACESFRTIRCDITRA
jgi:hypothetical protein